MLTGRSRRRWRRLFAVATVVLACCLVSSCTTGPKSTQPSQVTTAPLQMPPAPPLTTPTPTATTPQTEITTLAPLHPGKSTLLVDDPQTILLPTDDDPIGPDTFFVSGDIITIEDRVNGVLVGYRDGRRRDTVEIPPIQCCADMLIQNDRYWLLDGSHTLFEYKRKPGANKLTELNHYDIAGTQPSWVHAEGPNVVVELISGERILAAGPGPVDPGPGGDMLKQGWIIDDGPIQVRVDMRYDPISLSLLTRSADSSYYRLEEDNPQSDNPPNDGYVYQISNTGHLLRTFTLKNWGDVPSNRDVIVTANGTVYQMIITRKSTRIYRIKPNP